MLYFSNYSSDADSNILRETWARLIDQALSRGGIAEACSALKRVGPRIYPGDGAVIPLETICLHLEKAAQVFFFKRFNNNINFYCKSDSAIIIFPSSVLGRLHSFLRILS